MKIYLQLKLNENKSKLLLIIITAVTLLSFPKVNFGQAPDLGTASSFALFTAIGKFTNIGTTTDVTGDVGTHEGAFNAFPPGTLAGEIHVANSTSLQAKTDVNTAYNDLKTLTPDKVIEVTLGEGQILTPKTYSIGAASTLNGDLILDGEDDPDALFIFQIDGAFSTGKLSNVTLINSASLYNVYWQINGAFELGDGSVFMGTIIANGAISLLDNSSLFGRGLSIAGAISLNNDNVAILEMTPLPIGLLSFNAIPGNDFVNITWTTLSEANNDYFTIEKSMDAINFETVATIKGAGNSNALLNYSIKDNEPFACVSYYRLKQTDFDEKYSYSNIVAIDFVRQLTNETNIYPNPFSTSIAIIINNASQINKAELRIYNVFGAEVINTSITKQLTTIKTSNLLSGIYFYKVIDNDKIIQSGKLISQQ